MGETTMTDTHAAYRFAVLNVAVTQILGRYATREEAAAEAVKAGNCSFPYELSDSELAALEAQEQAAQSAPIEAHYDAEGFITLAIGETNAQGVAPLLLTQRPDMPELAELWQYDESQPAQTLHLAEFTISGDQGRDPWDIAREAAATYL